MIQHYLVYSAHIGADLTGGIPHTGPTGLAEPGLCAGIGHRAGYAAGLLHNQGAQTLKTGTAQA